MTGPMPPRRGMLASTRGSMAVEFAFVLVPFLLIVFGLLQVGVTFGAMAALNEAATETARALELEYPDDPPTAEDVLLEARTRFKGPDPNRVAAELDNGSAGQILRLTYDVPLLIPILDWNVSRLRAAALVGG
ncbi:TadE family protein [Meridianimarinicoccus sp. RP-17]|uniref:TadE family protein n=1 Tax=Meridianimarinicoccus zhengii TaxID=2056810 RepID=UPI000DAD5374|nr:TadE family protein [Phycocomes zhengii]